MCQCGKARVGGSCPGCPECQPESPERCPTCQSDDPAKRGLRCRNGHWDFRPFQRHRYPEDLYPEAWCPDSFHSPEPERCTCDEDNRRTVIDCAVHGQVPPEPESPERTLRLQLDNTHDALVRLVRGQRAQLEGSE